MTESTAEFGFTQFGFIKVTVDGPVAVLTIDRQDKLNALSAEVLQGLHDAVDYVDSLPEVRAAVLTGAGKAFVAGADIAAMQSLGAAEAETFSLLGHTLGEKMEGARFPIIAAVNGFALGGGCELMLACDFAYASTKAKLGQPEVNLGVIPGFGGTQRLTRRVGIARARELVFTGKRRGVEDAKQIGLVNAVFEPDALLDEAVKTAALIAEKGPLAIAAAKRVLLEGADIELPKANRLEAKAFGECFASADQKEGMAAFLEKRAPDFKGE